MPLPCRLDKKLFPRKGGRIALSANGRIAEFLDFAIPDKFAYVNKLRGGAYAPLPKTDYVDLQPDLRRAGHAHPGGQLRGTAIAPSWPSASSTSIMACCTGAFARDVDARLDDLTRRAHIRGDAERRTEVPVQRDDVIRHRNFLRLIRQKRLHRLHVERQRRAEQVALHLRVAARLPSVLRMRPENAARPRPFCAHAHAPFIAILASYASGDERAADRVGQNGDGSSRRAARRRSRSCSRGSSPPRSWRRIYLRARQNEHGARFRLKEFEQADGLRLPRRASYPSCRNYPDRPVRRSCARRG